MVTNLNNIIDINFYPTEKTRRSNFNHRPIGIGIQGLADTFFKMDIAFTSEEAKNLNKLIFETMYHAAMEQSNELAMERAVGMKIIRQYLDNDRIGFKNYDDKSVSIICDGNIVTKDGNKVITAGEIVKSYTLKKLSKYYKVNKKILVLKAYKIKS